MIIQNPTTQVSIIVAASKAVGVALPAKVAKAHEATSVALKAMRDIYPKAGLAPVVAAALLAGRDPAADPEVQRTHLAMQLGEHGVSVGVENILIERVRQEFTTQADAIVATWAKPFDGAAADLGRAFDRLGAIDLADTNAVVQQGGDAAEIWGKAQTASQTLSTITNGWTALVEFTRTANINRRYPALRIAAVDAATWSELELNHKRLSAWEAVVAGLVLALPTASQYRERIASLDRGIAELAMADAPVDRSREQVRAWARKTAATA